MTQINNSTGVNTNYYNQGPQPTQVATHVPGANPNYRPDQFQQQTNQPKQTGIGGLLGGEKKPYVTKQSVMTGLAGAGVGFMVGGPIGAVIGGVIGLLISVIMNIVNMKKTDNNLIPQQPMQIYPNQQNSGTTANQQYQQRLQQQQAQQANQQIQQNGQYSPQQYNPNAGR